MGDLEEMRARILQDPAYLQQVLQNLRTTNPQLYQLVQQNPQAALQILFGGAAPSGAPGAQGPPSGTIPVTEEEKAAINRLKSLGFTEVQAAQAFFACEKNEPAAANFLMDNSESLREEAQGIIGPAHAPGPAPAPAPGTAPIVVPQVPQAQSAAAEVKKEAAPENKVEGNAIFTPS